MRSLKITAVVAVMAVLATIGLQRAGLAQGTSLRIIAPQNGAQLTTDFVRVQFELLNPAVAGSPTPTYQLQLDSQDPVQTNSTDYTFTGLTPGQHTVLVQLVDANNTPISGGTNAVQFVVLPGRQPRSGVPPSSLPEATNPGPHRGLFKPR